MMHFLKKGTYLNVDFCRIGTDVLRQVVGVYVNIVLEGGILFDVVRPLYKKEQAGVANIVVGYVHQIEVSPVHIVALRVFKWRH